MQKIILFFILSLSFINIILAEEYIYILSDAKLNDLYFSAKKHFRNSQIRVFKDIRGVLITLEIDDILNEYALISDKTLRNLEKIEYFLAKMKNPVIIEVHTA